MSSKPSRRCLAAALSLQSLGKLAWIFKLRQEKENGLTCERGTRMKKCARRDEFIEYDAARGYISPNDEMRDMMEIARLFKALSDPSRLRALHALEGRELCVCQLIELLELAPSTVSRHLAVLANAGLVQSTKRGRWVYYRWASGHAEAGRILDMLPELWSREPQIAEDAQALIRIFALDPEVLCRLQQERSAPNVALGVGEHTGHAE